MIRLYTAAYGNSGMNARQVLEEMVCDAMGKMNAFATEETSTVAGEVGQFLRDMRKTALETQTDGQKNSAQKGVKFSIQNTQNMSWEDQIKGALYGEKNIRRNDTLVVGDVAAELVQDGVTQKPLAIPLSVMTKASNGKDISHSIKKGKLANLDSGIKNAPIVIVNPSRNAIVYVTNIKQGGAPILAAFDMNAVFDGDEVHKATSIHLQINVQSMLDNLPQSATVYVQNENELAAVGATNNLRGLAANVKFISDGSITNRGENVKQKYSRELDSEYMELAKDPEGNRRELQEMVDQAAEAAGYEYKRNTRRKHSPANDVPWQMFVRGVDKYQGNYGDYTYYATDKGATSIDEIMPKLRELAEEFYGETVSDEEINPPDIVMSAGVWDDMDFVQYAWDNYFEEEMDRTGKVPAVVTEDGMIVIDEDFSRVKSGDTVEYDDNGKVIPLSERFNSDKRDIRYSRELTTDGRIVAVVDEDILSNLDLSNWNQETKEAAQKAAAAALLKFQDGIAVEGITRKVNRISRKEFTRSEYTNELFWWNSTAFLDKMRAANNLDDVVIATTDWARDGKLKHPRTDNFVDFDHGTTLIASGDAKYEAEVVVGITDKGDAVFYDIVNMKQGDFSIKKEESSPTATTNKSPGSIFEDSSKKNVAQQSENVKQKYSRELETVEALKRQNEILQKQRDYWKEQTRTTDEKTRGADKGEVRSLAGQLIRQYSSKTEVEEILPEMQWLADSIWRNDPKISYTDLQDSAQNIARMVLDGSEVNLNAENWETGQELKRFLRGRYINVDESLKEDIGDFKNFKRSNRSLHFRENGTGTGVASLWLELQNDFGKGLFPDSISNPGDQIRHIADTLTSLTESDMRNPYAADMELTVEQMAYDVMARAAGVNRQKATKTDNTADSPLLYSVRMLTWAEVSWSMLPSS